MTENPTEFRVYTDGSAHGGAGGWAWVAVAPASTGHGGLGTRVDGGFGGVAVDATNNRMELQAVIEALTKAPPNVRLRIVTDSAYVSNCFLERWYGWRRNGWVNSKKKPVENRSHWEELIALVEARADRLSWTHIRGHGRRATDDPVDQHWNAITDEQAGQAREQAAEMETT